MELKNVYLAYDGRFYKIGESINPEKRVENLRKENPSIKLLHFNYGGTKERVLHKLFKKHNVFGEWFDLSSKQVEQVKYLIDNKKLLSETEANRNPIQQEAHELISELKKMEIKNPKHYFCKKFKKYANTKANKNRLDNLWYGKTTDVKFNSQLKELIKHFKTEYKI